MYIGDWLFRSRWSRWLTALEVALLAALIYSLVSTARLQAAPVSEQGEHEVITASGCGVERWALKTGMDSGASRVNAGTVVPTSIYKLRTLPAPAYLLPRSRVQPVEYTVFSVTAKLLRVKIEADSDYHLVLADSGGRTMIAEIPSPSCVSLSPFLPQIRYTRSKFTAAFHPGESWHRLNLNVQVTGVGFFSRGFEHAPHPQAMLETSRGAISVVGIDSILEALQTAS